jgi:hypothetical protein
VFGEYRAASLTVTAPLFHSVSCPTTVTLTGTVRTSAGSFCAVTTTVGNWNGPAGPGGATACAKTLNGTRTDTMNKANRHTGMRVIMQVNACIGPPVLTL